MNLLAPAGKDIEIDYRDWPRCAQCHMPVQHLHVTDTGNGLVFVVQCHGETESAELPDEVWDTMLGTHPTFGLAFRGENNELDN